MNESTFEFVSVVVIAGIVAILAICYLWDRFEK